jgi:sporulation protein YlmC with PRC-barrel domain
MTGRLYLSSERSRCQIQTDGATGDRSHHIKEAKMRIVYEESMSGHSVIDSTGRVIGEVVGQVLEVESWHVAALRVKLNSAVTQEIGASHGAFRAARLDIPTDFIQGVTDTVILRGPVSALRTLETQSGEHAPS